MNDDLIEQELRDAIRSVHYFTGAQGLIGVEAMIGAGEWAKGEQRPIREVNTPYELGVLTICVILLKNGYMLVGYSAPADHETFDAQKGKEAAYRDALAHGVPIMAFIARENVVRYEMARARIESEMAARSGSMQ